MAEQTVTVTPGTMATLSVNMVAGTTIVNQSGTDAVWVSSTPAAAPGVGLRIGALGSLSWAASGPVYAVTDTGVVNPVTLSLSSLANNPVNPADVGSAVAAKLLAQGVPNVLQGDVIFNGTVPGVTAKIFTGLAKYASLSITVNSPNHGQIWDFLQEAQGYTTSDISIPQAINPGGSFPLTISLPVQGDLLSIGWSYADPGVSITIYASNRPQPFQILSASTQPVTASLNQAFTTGLNADFPPILTGNGKPWQARAVVTGAGNKGFLGIRTLNGSLDILDTQGGFAGSDGTELDREFIMPIGITRFYFGPRTTGTYTVVLTLLPGQ